MNNKEKAVKVASEDLTFYKSYVSQVGKKALTNKQWRLVLRKTMEYIWKKVLTEGFVFTDPSNCGDLYVCESRRQGQVLNRKNPIFDILDNTCTDGKIFKMKYDGKIVRFAKYMSFKGWRNPKGSASHGEFAGSSGLCKWIMSMCKEGKTFRAIKEGIM